jgi:hypothetical protein
MKPKLTTTLRRIDMDRLRVDELNLSGWIKRRKSDVGPYADHIIKSVKRYEEEIMRLRRELGLTHPAD